MNTTTNTPPAATREPWNRGKLVGQKAPLKLKEIWAIRVRLQLSENLRDLALFDLAIDSKLRGCDLVKAGLRSGSCCASWPFQDYSLKIIALSRSSPAAEKLSPGEWKG